MSCRVFEDFRNLKSEMSFPGGGGQKLSVVLNDATPCQDAFHAVEKKFHFYILGAKNRDQPLRMQPNKVAGLVFFLFVRFLCVIF